MVPYNPSMLDNCSDRLKECEKIKNDKIKETEECIGAMQQCTKLGEITTETKNVLVSVIDAQQQAIKELEEQMNTKIQECEQLQKQIDDKSSNEDIVPHNTHRLDNCAQCSDFLKECKQNSEYEQKNYEGTLNTYINNLEACESNVDKKDAAC